MKCDRPCATLIPFRSRWSWPRCDTGIPACIRLLTAFATPLVAELVTDAPKRAVPKAARPPSIKACPVPWITGGAACIKPPKSGATAAPAFTMAPVVCRAVFAKSSALVLPVFVLPASIKALAPRS